MEQNSSGLAYGRSATHEIFRLTETSSQMVLLSLLLLLSSSSSSSSSQDLVTGPYLKPDESYSKHSRSFLKTCFNIIIPAVPGFPTIPRVDFTSTLDRSPESQGKSLFSSVHATYPSHSVGSWYLSNGTHRDAPNNTFLSIVPSVSGESAASVFRFFLLSRFKQQISLELFCVGCAGQKNTSAHTTVANNVCVYRVRV